MAQPSVEVQSTLNGLFKEVYASMIKDLVPNSNILMKEVEFVQKEQREGNKYHQPVLVALPSGLTWGLGAVTLNSAIASQLQDAQVTGSQVVGRDLLAFDVAAKAAKGGKQSFGEATALIVKNLVKATAKAVELDLLYGGAAATGSAGLGLGATTAGAQTSVDATHENVVIQAAHWAPAIWSGFENARFNFYDNTNGTLVSSGADSIFTLVQITISSRTLEFSGTSTGITALNGNNNALNIYFNTANGNQMTGVHGILTNTGTLFNINAATYSLWLSNSYSAGSAQLTFGKLQNAISNAVARGLDSETITLVSPFTYANLVNEQAGARVFDKSYDPKVAENGMEAIEFYGPNGKNKVICHIFVKQGFAYVLPKEEMVRCGPVEDVVMNLPGLPQDQFFLLSPTLTAWELRTYANQAILLEYPAHAVVITNIVNVQ